MMQMLATLMTNRYLALIFRLYLGGLFVYASMYKIQYPDVFAETIANYQLVPVLLVNPMAVLMPWVELVAGVLLMAGVRSKAAVIVLGSMLIMFTLALVYVLLAEIPIGCGCFHSQEDEATWLTVLRDIGWLAMAVHVFFFDTSFHLENRYSWRFEEIES